MPSEENAERNRSIRVRVTFRGPMLFLSKKDIEHVHEIVIPNANKDGCHFDHTDARRHFAGILIVKGKDQTAKNWIDLSGESRVIIKARGESGPPKAHSSCGGKLDLKRMINPRTLDRISPPSAMSVSLTGGVLKASVSSPTVVTAAAKYTLPAPLTTWETSSEVSYQIDGAEPEKLGADEQLYVYNWDQRYPTADELTKPVQLSGEYADLDAKWIYRLFKPSNGESWKHWLAGGLLPVPQSAGYQPTPCGYLPPPPPGSSRSQKARGGSTGTCDSFMYVEGT